MSLFPAYISLTSTSNNDTQVTKTPSPTPSNQTEDWLTNSSFQVANVSAAAVVAVGAEAPIEVQSDDDAVEAIDSDDEVDDSSKTEKRASSSAKKRSKKKKKKRRKAKRAKSDTKSASADDDDDDDDDDDNNKETKIEFTGQEDYYVDKTGRTDKSDVARYHTKIHLLGTLTPKQWQMMYKSKKDKSKRYFVVNLGNNSGDEAAGSANASGSIKDNNNSSTNTSATTTKTYRMTEDEFIVKGKTYNRRLADDSGDIDAWLEFIRFQEHFYMKMTKVQLAERKMEILNRALHENPSNDRLYREYISILEGAYPSFEVSKFLDNLIKKDPANYILWNAQIMATQGSMARCRVPDVLALYEKCMKNMYKRNRCDEVTLRLFNSCALFLRQSGLSEQFFALLALALELNVSEDRFSNIEPKDTDPNALIQYEEIVLNCGLPMNEIWLRVEKLRQNFFFLPCSMDRSCSDPQRVVLNEDILHFIYPIANRDYAFRLVCIVLKLLKVPLIDSAQFKQYVFNAYNCDNTCHFDSIEDITPLYLHRTIFNGNQCMDDILWRLIRDYVIGPSYITSLIGYDLYIRYISEVLLQLADCYGTNPAEHPSKRNMFILLLLRLERIVMKFDFYMDKWNDDKTKRLRTKIKNLLKRDENRNCLTFYVEFAQIEYELKRFEQAKHIYVAAISQSNPQTDDDCTRSEYWYICISFIEMLIRERKIVKALNLLNTMAMDDKLPASNEDGNDNDDDGDAEMSETVPSAATNLLAANKLDERLKAICFIERNVTIMDVVQIFQPDYLLCVIKANIYHKLLWNKSKADAVQQMEQLLKTFPEKNQRHQFIREQLYELYADVLQYKMNAQHGSGSGSRMGSMSAENAQFEMIQRALDEFPTNTYLLKCAAMCHNQPWHRVRGLFSKHASPISTVFLIAAVRYRCKQYVQIEQCNREGQPIVDLENSWTMPSAPNTDDLQQAYTIRVINFLRKSTDHDAFTSKNSLVWRFLLRYMLEMGYGYEKCRNTLLTALNECPWNKALYLDGTICVPQELAHIQDLIIEKQLRIYAMPEELEILRNFDEVQ